MGHKRFRYQLLLITVLSCSLKIWRSKVNTWFIHGEADAIYCVNNKCVDYVWVFDCIKPNSC